MDLTGLACGPKAAFATKGYFAHERGRHGRQLGCVLATRYHEVVVDQLYPGVQSLVTALPGLVQAAAEVLEFDAAKRRRTLLRIDGGGGSVADINWARGTPCMPRTAPRCGCVKWPRRSPPGAKIRKWPGGRWRLRVPV